MRLTLHTMTVIAMTHPEAGGLAERLRAHREAAGLSQEVLAQRASAYLPRRLSVTHTKVRNYESGRTSERGADLVVLAAFAVVLGTTLDELVPGGADDGRQAVKVMRMAMAGNGGGPGTQGDAGRGGNGATIARTRANAKILVALPRRPCSVAA